MSSFAELAASVGQKIEQREVRQFGPLVAVEAKCGKKALRIFQLLTHREACKMYGHNGAIIMTPLEIALELDMPVSSVIGCLISLVRNGYARPTSDGNAIKAA